VLCQKLAFARNSPPRPRAASLPRHP
jgi:hypothetical protein